MGRGPAVHPRVRPRIRSRLLRAIVTRPRTILLVTVVVTILAAIVGVGAVSRMKTGGFDDPGSDSVRGTQALLDRFGSADPNLVVLIGSTAGVETPAVRTKGQDVTATLRREPGLQVVASYWETPVAELRGRSGDVGLIVAHVDGDQDESAEHTGRLHDLLTRAEGPTDGVTVSLGGLTQINNDINTQVTKDLARAESIAIPVTLALLLVVFGTVVAAGIPLIIGILSIIGTLGALAILATLTEVSVFAVNLTTALGLGLAIDYCLLFISRYREERRRHYGTVAALDATMRSAGRTIVFSAATVAAALCCLLVFPQYFLRSFAFAGVAVVAITLVGALIILPALLLLLRGRIERWPLPWRRRSTRTKGRTRSRARSQTSGLSAVGRVAAVAWRYPARTAIPTLAVLLLLGVPFLHVTFGVPDDRVLPTSAESRQTADRLRADFAAPATGALAIIATTWGTGPAAATDTSTYASRLSAIPGVDRVDSAAGSYTAGRLSTPPTPATAARFANGAATWFSILSRTEPYSPAGAHLAHAVRAAPVPQHHRVLVTGQAAQLLDITGSIGHHLPLALALIAIITFTVLFLLTGSVVLPLKALVFNLLSLSAVFGAMVWIFQDGHLAGPLGITPAPLPVAIPVLLFCITYGLSMDYAVFVLARIREQHDSGTTLRQAVITGLSRSGRIISAAALILAVSFFSTLVSGVSFIKLFGLGTGLAILLDALIVRPVLVPAFMRLAGDWNWWAPRPLRALHNRIGIREQ
ncbi:MMPL family transporter [Protofrankia coriariae]|uniref:MMPL family transporter n=1 Tax=Protofrankia coriariae TaxID=1562887 RepID=UPI001F339996|nr:MMPL family transporter [Protofrankia coriariae]